MTRELTLTIESSKEGFLEEGSQNQEEREWLQEHKLRGGGDTAAGEKAQPPVLC